MDTDKLKEIEKQIGYSFNNRDRLVQAFTTKSYAKEENDHKRPCKSQEEYRTHGDAILKEVLIELLKEHGLKTPQHITEAKAQLECGAKLAEIFSSFQIPADCFQKRTGEPISLPLCAETFESLICAMYLDISSTTNEGNAKKEIKMYIATLFEPHINNIL